MLVGDCVGFKLRPQFKIADSDPVATDFRCQTLEGKRIALLVVGTAS